MPLISVRITSPKSELYLLRKLKKKHNVINKQRHNKPNVEQNLFFVSPPTGDKKNICLPSR